ncbi:MAG: hypothetical protein AAGA12_11905 [Pseudomonadota bacterium]
MQRKSNVPNDCGREPGAKECTLADLGLDPVEEQLLAITRHVFQSFAVPGTQGWLNGLALAEQAFGHDGPRLFARLVDALLAVRATRRSCFIFNSPMCPCCSKVVTEHERRLITALSAIRRGLIGRARTELMMLCEGAEAGAVIHALVALSRHLPTPDEKKSLSIAIQ